METHCTDPFGEVGIATRHNSASWLMRCSERHPRLSFDSEFEVCFHQKSQGRRHCRPCTSASMADG